MAHLDRLFMVVLLVAKQDTYMRQKTVSKKQAEAL